MKWQPIETAPKDKPILMWCKSETIVEARWDEDFSIWSYNYHETLIDDLGAMTVGIEDGTHWMPVPAPPINSLESEG